MDHQVRMNRSVGVTKTGLGEWKVPSRARGLNIKRNMIIVRFHQNCQSWSARAAGVCYSKKADPGKPVS